MVHRYIIPHRSPCKLCPGDSVRRRRVEKMKKKKKRKERGFTGVGKAEQRNGVRG